MGAVILVTVGILFLISNFTRVGFDDTWPVILIVVGLFIYLGRSAPLEGHVQPYFQVGPVVPPPPASQAPSPQQPPQQSYDPQVKP